MKGEEFYKRETLLEGEKREEKAPPPLPEKIGIYKIESLLNVGGMSLLYLGIHPETSEPITVKVLSSAYTDHPEVADRFLKEAKIIELADHPNIVKLYGHGEWEGGLYIAMEFIQGLSLRDMILQQATSLRRSLEIVLQIAYALAHLHTHGIIHRDLKPENVLLTNSGGIKVIDFGIAAFYTEKDEKTSQKRKVMGTPAYMSPEQREDPKKVTFSSDIYSLGLITYELIIGRLSFGQVHISLVPKGLQKIIAKALQPDVASRYEDIVDFIMDISGYLASDEWKKEMRGSDYLGEMKEQLKEAHSFFWPRMAPSWPEIDVMSSSNYNEVMTAVYCDFLEKKNGVYGVILAEVSVSGIEGVLHMAYLKGVLKGLSQNIEEPSELIVRVNEEILKEGRDVNYSLLYLTLEPGRDLFSYISCGYFPLWHLPFKSEVPRRVSADNIALGLMPLGEVLSVEGNFNVGDTLFLHTFQAHLLSSVEEVEKDENEFLEILKENRFLSQKLQLESISRKLGRRERIMHERPQTLISLVRKA